MALPNPPYQYKEFPKWVTGADGVEAIVQDKSEEANFLAEHDKKRGRKPDIKPEPVIEESPKVDDGK